MGSVTRNPIRRNVSPYRPPTFAPQTTSRPAPKPAPRDTPHRTCDKPAPAPPDGLYLLIAGTPYLVERIDREPGDEALCLVRLHKPDGITCYDLARLPEGIEC